MNEYKDSTDIYYNFDLLLDDFISELHFLDIPEDTFFYLLEDVKKIEFYIHLIKEKGLL